MPVTIIPGTISLVSPTIASSAVFMSRAFIPGTLSIIPMLFSRFTPVAPNGPSCPHELTTTFASMILGSMHDCMSWFIDTNAQFVRQCHRDLIMMMTTPESSLRSNSRSPLSIKNRMVNPATYSSRIATDIPLLESTGASFDQYLEDKPRVFKAIFPDKRRAYRLNEDAWRIQMLPIQFLFLTVWPVIDMRLRCKSGGIGYPPGVPQHITKLIELDIIRWELQGLDDIFKPAEFTLGVKGTMYPDRQGTQTRLKGQLKMSISFVLPPVLALVPEDVRQSVAQSVLKRLVENMKHRVNGSLLADYSEFKRERLNKAVV